MKIDGVPKNVRKALQVIQEFCSNKDDCCECPLSDNGDSCKILDKPVPPEFWKIESMESEE